MEKTGVEKEIVSQETINGIQKTVVKTASTNSCDHPLDRRVDTKNGIHYCRKCEKYLEADK